MQCGYYDNVYDAEQLVEVDGVLKLLKGFVHQEFLFFKANKKNNVKHNELDKVDLDIQVDVQNHLNQSKEVALEYLEVGQQFKIIFEQVVGVQLLVVGLQDLALVVDGLAVELYLVVEVIIQNYEDHDVDFFLIEVLQYLFFLGLHEQELCEFGGKKIQVELVNDNEFYNHERVKEMHYVLGYVLLVGQLDLEVNDYENMHDVRQKVVDEGVEEDDGQEYFDYSLDVLVDFKLNLGHFI